MKIYLIGKIVYIGTNYVILDVNQVGYKLIVINTNNYHLQETKKLYISIFPFYIINPKAYAFQQYAELMMFECLTKINGISAIKAIEILTCTLAIDLIFYIANEKYEALAEIKWITNEIATQLINNFKIECSTYLQRKKEFNPNFNINLKKRIVK